MNPKFIISFVSEKVFSLNFLDEACKWMADEIAWDKLFSYSAELLNRKRGIRRCRLLMIGLLRFESAFTFQLRRLKRPSCRPFIFLIVTNIEAATKIASM